MTYTSGATFRFLSGSDAMDDAVRVAVIGLGRIGAVHAGHVKELAAEQGQCRLTALVDSDPQTAVRLARSLAAASSEVRTFYSVQELIDSEASDVSIVATPTPLHKEHAEALIQAGQRVLLEKPMTNSLEADRVFARWLDQNHPEALMLAFQRRFDEPLRQAKQLLEQEATGRPFKIVSVLEDSRPLPTGYESPGILTDMSVHNVDEMLWLLGHLPRRAASLGANLFSHRVTSAQEDYDDSFLHLWFDDELIGQIQVSRNHVSGYRVETWIFGEEGQIHVGRFEQDRFKVVVEAYGRQEAIDRKVFSMRDYQRPMPEFVDRFGPAYKAEVAAFIEHCANGEPFPVSHNDGLRAMEVIDAALRGAIVSDMAARLGVASTAQR